MRELHEEKSRIRAMDQGSYIVSTCCSGK